MHVIWRYLRIVQLVEGVVSEGLVLTLALLHCTSLSTTLLNMNFTRTNMFLLVGDDPVRGRAVFDPDLVQTTRLVYDELSVLCAMILLFALHLLTFRSSVPAQRGRETVCYE